MDRLTQAREEYARAVATMHTAAVVIDEAAADITADALAELEATFTAAETQVTETTETVARFERTAAARAIALPAPPAAPAADPAPAGVQITNEPLTYRRHGEHSFFTDMLRASVQGDSAARERLNRHMTEVRSASPERFALSSTDAAGGQLVSPVYLNDMFVDLATAGRPIANAIGSRPLPANTDSINIPTLSTGTAVAQQADNTAVAATDATFSTLAADVKTIAGMQDVSQQLIDRSVPGVDEVIYADLVKRYNIALDVNVINSAVANNLGVLNVAGVNAITYTDATPTVPELYAKLADAIQQVHTGIFMPPNACFMAPRRWAWILASLDTQNRPLVTPYAPMNAVGATAGVVSEGPVGSIQGVPVWVDANMPLTLGAGTEDKIIICRSDELLLWEEGAGPFFEVFRDVLSGTLGVRLRLHNYEAQMFARRPKAISIISGTGLIAPTF